MDVCHESLKKIYTSINKYYKNHFFFYINVQFLYLGGEVGSWIKLSKGPFWPNGLSVASKTHVFVSRPF